MSQARINVAVTPEFKAQLKHEAERDGISLSELVWFRCFGLYDPDALLSELSSTVVESVKKADKSLTRGLQSAEQTLANMRTTRTSSQSSA
jgi:hypothetical protein